MLFCKQCFLKVLSIVFRTCHPRIIGGTFLQRDMARLRLFMSYLYEKKVLSSIEDQEETNRCADRLSYKKVEKRNLTKTRFEFYCFTLPSMC